MDLKGPFGTKPTPRDNRYVLVTIYLLTRAAELVPIPNKTAETVANALVKEVFCRQGIPESFLTDRQIINYLCCLNPTVPFSFSINIIVTGFVPRL